MFLVLLSQTHYFSLLVFLSCGPPFIRLSCDYKKKRNPKHRKKCDAGPHYNAALASERGRWWLRKEGGTEGRKRCLFLDIIVSKNNSGLGWVLWVCCHSKWWMLHVSRPCESIAVLQGHLAEKFQVNQSCHRVYGPFVLWKSAKSIKGVYFALYFKWHSLPIGWFGESFIRRSPLMACPPEDISVGEGALRKTLECFGK